ncbi:voltage-gated potassium channel regulatory subunit KCNF1-like [Brachyhypopomus gauderio]|uniref:voltage-gated potassium channel regulatory subunit KCNF1-like n=1 Tax=Brachyhypopomus gauderio TaxID=698409 RepID=UPI00404300A4
MRETPRTCFAGCNASVGSEVTEIVVNIGGVKQVLYVEALNRYPETRLAELANCSSGNASDLSDLCDDYDVRKGEFYFDRDPDVFKCIIELYYYGEVHMKKGICPECFKKEMEFWGVDVDFLDECCKGNLKEVEEELAQIAKKVRTILHNDEGTASASMGKRCQLFLWKLMEKPESSYLARVVTILSFVFSILSSVVMCVSTIPELHTHDSGGQEVENPTLQYIEMVCIIWFTAEYVLRLASAPNKVRFVFSFMNMVDFLTIMPFYLMLVLINLGTAVTELASVQHAVQALRVMRIVRIFKLARHSEGLHTLTYALKSSLKELLLLLIYMGMGIFLFSVVGYALEQSHPDTLFTSFSQSFWWAIITMTMVGYGDVYPKTTLGRCNAAVSFLCGIIAIALPMHLIINRFVIFYSKQRLLDVAAKHEIELLELRSKEDQVITNQRTEEPSGPSAPVWDEASQIPQSGTSIPLQDGGPRPTHSDMQPELRLKRRGSGLQQSSEHPSPDRLSDFVRQQGGQGVGHRMQRVEEYELMLQRLRVDDTEEYNTIKAKLETDVQVCYATRVTVQRRSPTDEDHLPAQSGETGEQLYSRMLDILNNLKIKCSNQENQFCEANQS